MNTFVVRIWTPSEDDADARVPLRGLVEHVGSGRSTPFASERELLAFLAQVERADAPRPGSERLR